MKRLISALLLGLLLLITLVSPLGGCDEECLVAGENCSASYKQSAYGTTDIYCCSGNCQQNHLKDFVCR